MKNLRANFATIVLSIFISISSVSAHLKAGSLSIKGGETFSVGESVPVSLVQNIGHNNGKYDFYYSVNAGTAWTEIVGNFQGPKGDGDTIKYIWVVPSISGSTVQFRACQLAGGECLDNTYILKSGNFTVVAAGTSIADNASHAAKPSIQYKSASGNINVTFAIVSSEQISFKVYDMNGALLATLLDEPKNAGQYSFSLFSNSLQSFSGPLVFKLMIGSKITTQVWGAK